MELKINKAETFRDAMGVDVDNMTSFLIMIGQVMKLSDQRSDVARHLWELMQTDEQIARIVLFIALRESEDLFTNFLDDPKIVEKFYSKNKVH